MGGVFLNMKIITSFLILIGIFWLLSISAGQSKSRVLSIFWGFLNAILYIATGAIYKPWDTVKIYTAITCAVLFGGSRTIPLMIFIMLLVHLWVLMIGNAKKPVD